MVFLKVIPDNENVSKSFQKSLEGTVYVIGCRKLHFSCWTRFYDDSGGFFGNSGISCFWRWSPILGQFWFVIGMAELNWNSQEGWIGTGAVFFWLYFENDLWEEGTVLVAKWGGWEMPEIKKSWLTCYGLSDHDFSAKWFEWGGRGGIKGFRDGSPFPPHPPFGHLLPRGRRFSFAFWNSGFCNSGQALRAEWHEAAVRDWKKNPGVIDVHSWGIIQTR